MSNTIQFLSEKFSPSSAITRAQFREFVGISISTDWRAFKSGKYPRVVRIGDHDRILLVDLAAFFDQQKQEETPAETKRGRPKRTVSPAELLATLGS